MTRLFGTFFNNTEACLTKMTRMVCRKIKAQLSLHTGPLHKSYSALVRRRIRHMNITKLFVNLCFKTMRNLRPPFFFTDLPPSLLRLLIKVWLQCTNVKKILLCQIFVGKNGPHWQFKSYQNKKRK